MLIGGAFLVFGIGAACVLVCRLAVDAFPAFIACTVGFWAYGTGAGLGGAAVVAAISGVTTLAAGRLVVNSTSNRVVRGLVALLFAAPAALAGYHVVLGLGRLLIPAEIWQHAFSAVGALLFGLAAGLRIRGENFRHHDRAAEASR